MVVTVEGGLERYHLPFPGAGNRFVSKMWRVSRIFPLRYSTVAVPSDDTEMTLTRYQPGVRLRRPRPIGHKGVSLPLGVLVWWGLTI